MAKSYQRKQCSAYMKVSELDRLGPLKTVVNGMWMVCIDDTEVARSGTH